MKLSVKFTLTMGTAGYYRSMLCSQLKLKWRMVLKAGFDGKCELRA
jgi:hypothetical protein